MIVTFRRIFSSTDKYYSFTYKVANVHENKVN